MTKMDNIEKTPNDISIFQMGANQGARKSV